MPRSFAAHVIAAEGRDLVFQVDAAKIVQRGIDELARAPVVRMFADEPGAAVDQNRAGRVVEPVLRERRFALVKTEERAQIIGVREERDVIAGGPLSWAVACAEETLPERLMSPRLRTVRSMYSQRPSRFASEHRSQNTCLDLDAAGLVVEPDGVEVQHVAGQLDRCAAQAGIRVKHDASRAGGRRRTAPSFLLVVFLRLGAGDGRHDKQGSGEH